MPARVLLVDDNPLNLKLLAARLAREYYVVDTALDGMQALENVRRQMPDIILLDVMMPEMDGFEVCRRLRADPATRHIPVIMVTALTDVNDRVQGLEAGADDFLSKPINEVALLARVRSLLRLKYLMDEWRLRERTAMQFGHTAPPAETVEVSLAGGRALIINEDEIERQQVTRQLEAERMEVVSASDAGEAVTRLKEASFDVVVGSLSFGSEAGLQLCGELRSDETTRNVPILMLADEDDIVRVARLLEVGANDYILRPIDANELAARVRTQVRHSRYYARLRENYERSLAMALTDPLTGAFNRRYLDIQLPRLFERAAGGQRPIAALMLDIDHFKKINDTYGHPAGDAVLKELVDRLNKNLRSFDRVARMGGEEFAVIMPETDHEQAMMIGQRLCQRMAEQPIMVAGQEGPIPITVSIGVASAALGDDTPASLLKTADQALYRAKNEGRNRVISATAA